MIPVNVNYDEDIKDQTVTVMMIIVKGSFCSVWAGASLYYATV